MNDTSATSPSAPTWKQRGAAYLWRYDPSPGDLVGWHFTADHDGWESLMELADLLIGIEAPMKRLVTLGNPTSAITHLPVDPKGRRIVTARRIRFVVDPNDRAEYWSLAQKGEEVELQLGQDQLNEWRSALARAQQGDDDFAIGHSGRKAKEQSLWFWAMLSST